MNCSLLKQAQLLIIVAAAAAAAILSLKMPSLLYVVPQRRRTANVQKVTKFDKLPSFIIPHIRCPFLPLPYQSKGGAAPLSKMARITEIAVHSGIFKRKSQCLKITQNHWELPLFSKIHLIFRSKKNQHLSYQSWKTSSRKSAISLSSFITCKKMQITFMIGFLTKDNLHCMFQQFNLYD